MPDYNTMRQDAVRRAIEMQTKAKAAPVQEEKKEEPMLLSKTNETEQIPIQKQPDIFTILFQDKEKTLIMILLLLLASEKTDPALIFSLLYLCL